MKAALLFVSILFCLSTYAQDADRNSPLQCTNFNAFYCKEWTNAGLGAASGTLLNGISGLNAGLDAHWMLRRFTCLAGINTTTAVLGEGDNLTVINAGLGKSISKRVYLLSVCAGPGLMWGRNFEKEPVKKQGTHFVTGGLSVNAEGVLKVIKNFGLGIELFSNLNTVQSSSGIRFVIHLNNDK